MPPRRKKKPKATRLCSAYAAPTTVPVLQLVAKELSWKLVDVPEASAGIYWVCQNDRVVQLVRDLAATQLIGRYPQMNVFCNKVPFALIIGQAARLFPEEFYFWPMTYSLPGDEEKLQQAMNKTKTKEFFIVKPDEGSQGDGIFLTSSWSDLVARMGGFPFQGNWVAQSYMADPYLIDGMKFDLRLYVLLTSVGRCYRAFLCKEGLVRLCTQPYQAPTEKTRHRVNAHLTNYSLNKKSDSFLRGEDGDETGGDGSKRSLTSVMRLLQEKGEDVQVLWDKLMTLVANTVAALHGPTMEALERIDSTGENLFQVLGFDVLLDSHLSPTLLEVNNHPSMAIDTPVPLDELTEEDESSDLWEYLNKEKDVATTSGAAGKSARNSSLASNSFRQTAASSSSSTCGGDEENNDSESTSSGTPDSLDSQPIVDLCMAAEGSTPSWAKELLHDLRGLTASFVQSSFGTLKAESLSGGSSVEEGESRQSAPLAVCSGSSAASSVLEASLYPSVHARFTPGKPKKPQIRRGADNATQPGAAELQQRSLDTRRIISEMGAPSGLTSTSSGPVHGGRLPEAAKPTPPDLKAKSSMVCPGSKPARTATKKREGNGALPKKPPLHPTKAIAKPKPWGAPCSKSKHDPTAPDVAKPVSVTQATSRALRTPSISPPQARAQGEGQSVRQLRIEASKAVKVCNCKELQTPHRHVVGPVDHYVKFRMLLAVMRIVTSLKIGHDPLDIEEVDQVFEECSPCLGGRDKDGEDEELLDDNGEEMCVSPLLYRLYKMYNSCTTMKGDNSSSRIRHVQPFKLRRWALNSSLLAPCGALKAVDVDILYRQWAMQENETVTAECGGYVSFLDLLFQLAERGLPDTPLGPALWQLLNINSTHGRIKTSKTA